MQYCFSNFLIGTLQELKDFSAPQSSNNMSKIELFLVSVIHFNNNNNNNNNWNLYSAFSIHKMFKSAAHCHSLSNSPQRLNGRA